MWKTAFRWWAKHHHSGEYDSAKYQLSPETTLFLLSVTIESPLIVCKQP